ncbi:MAG TPA: hypothetical protein VKE73_14100 [Myxococcota bacterium]|nr:hypothetical protein [Myxococcota bacterium]
MHFAWPVGLTARVEYQQEGEARTPQGPESIVFRSSHRMRVEQAQEGIRVVHDEFLLLPVTSGQGAKSSGNAGPQDPLEPEPSGQVGDLLPDLIVDRTGNLMRISGIDRLRQEALERMAKGTEQTPDSRARLERWIAHAISDAELTERAKRDWSALVSFWVGARVPAGVTDTPAAGGSAASRLSVTPRVPCDAGDKSSRCVRIELESHPAPELRHTLFLVTEPDRLVPHELRVVAEIHGEVPGPDGKPNKVDQRDTWGYRFTYASAQ